MTRNYLIVFLLVVAIQFSQTIGAPSQEVDDSEPKTDSSSTAPQNVQLEEYKPETDSSSTAPQNGQPEEYQPPARAPIELPDRTLTKEEEKEILKKIPEFEIIMKSLEELPDGQYQTIKEFMWNLVPLMPKDNLITIHFQNAKLMIQLFERVVKMAHVHEDDRAARKELFSTVHEAVPQLKFEMDTADGFIRQVQTRLGKDGTSESPLENREQRDDTFSSIQLPVFDDIPAAPREEERDQSQYVGNTGESYESLTDIESPAGTENAKDEFVEEFAPADQVAETVPESID